MPILRSVPSKKIINGIEVTIRPDKSKIDEQYDEVEIGKGACVEFHFIGGNWYILSSDGLKLD